jgi:predicted transcriptional regulator
MNVQDTLAQLRNVRKSGAGWTARCPTHDDRQNSLSISEGREGKTLLKCHAGCSYQIIMDTFSSETVANSTRRIAAVYDYRDENGTLLYQSVRYEPKDFRQRRPDGAGGFVWNLRAVRRVPYRLPELLQSDKQATVFIVEGEKDADRLASLGLTTTTNIGGAGKWRAEYNEPFYGRRICILPDNDNAGAHNALQVARALHGTAESVKIITLPNLPPKGDASDYLDAGNTKEQLLALVTNAPDWTPNTSQDIEKIKTTRFNFTTLDDLLAEPEEQIGYVWDRTLPHGGFSICAAKPKVGKSTLARNLAVAISRGAEFLGRATAQGKVIYLCLEEKRAEVAAHFRRMGASSNGILIHTGRTPDDSLEALEAAIDEHKPALVIIDPLSRFVRVSDFNSYAEVTRGLEPLIDLARESGCHIHALHHNGKGEREGGDALLGSTGFFGAVDALLTMKRRERVRTLETLQRYGNDMPETVVHMDAESGLVTAGGDLSALQVEEHKSKVLEALGDETLTEGDIRERAGGNQSLVSKALRSLCEGGHVERSGAGKRGDPYKYERKSVSRFSILEEPRNQENQETNAAQRTLSDDEAELAAQFEHYGAPRREADTTARRMLQDVPF